MPPISARRWFPLVLAVALAVPAGQLQAFNFKKEQPVTFEVKDARTKAPVKDAEIILRNKEYGDFRAGGTGDGRYTAAKVITTGKQAVVYDVQVKARHYREQQVQLSVVFMDGKDVVAAVELERDLKKQAVAGVVQDAAGGAPVAGARLRFTNKDFGRQEAESGKDGRFQLAPGLTADPDPAVATPWRVEVEAAYYKPFVLDLGLLVAAGETALEPRLERDLRLQAVCGTVTDEATGEVLAGAKLSFHLKGGADKVDVESDAQGKYRVQGGLKTDTCPERSFAYDATVVRDRYQQWSGEARIAFRENGDLVRDFALRKQLLAPPVVREPENRKAVLSRRPLVRVEIPEALRAKLGAVQVQVSEDEQFKTPRFAAELKNPQLEKGSLVAYRLEKKDALDEDKTWWLRAKAVTTDRFETGWAVVSFSIPGSRTLNPPFPEISVLADDFVNLNPAWCELDGTPYILFASNRGDDAAGSYQVWRAKPGAAGVTQVTTATQNSNDMYPVWGPGAKNITFVSNRIGDVPNLWSVPIAGAKLLTQRTSYQKGEVLSPTASQQADVIVFARRGAPPKPGDTRIDCSIWTVSAEGGANLTQLCNGTQPALSPSGKFIAFVGDETGNREIWRIGTDGTGKTQLTSTPTSEEYPAWVDDTKLVYASDKSGNWDLWLLDVESGLERQLTNNLADETMPACSPKGEMVAFISDRRGKHDLYCIDLTKVLEDQSGGMMKKKAE